jgi:hypothetical protein
LRRRALNLAKASSIGSLAHTVTWRAANIVESLQRLSGLG